jgi:hypothetical protein
LTQAAQFGKGSQNPSFPAKFKELIELGSKRKTQKQMQGRQRGMGTFGERDDVVVLEAEAALAVAEALADNVAGSVLAPPLWVSSWYRLCLCPAQDLRL